MLKKSLSTLSEILRKFEVFVLAYGILALALISVTNMLCRNFLSMSLSFAEELSQILIIWITFLGTAYAAREGRHIRMSAIYDQLSVKAKRGLMTGISLLTALMMFTLAVLSIQYIHAVYTIGMNSPALDIPFALIYIAAPVGFVITGIQYLLTAYRNLTEEEVYLSFERKDTLAEEAVRDEEVTNV